MKGICRAQTDGGRLLQSKVATNIGEGSLAEDIEVRMVAKYAIEVVGNEPPVARTKIVAPSKEILNNLVGRLTGWNNQIKKLSYMAEQ